MRIYTDIPELLRLWHDLPGAVLRLQGTTGGDVITGGAGPAPSPPLDVNASEALTRLVSDVYATSTAVEQTLGEHPSARTAFTRIQHLPRQHDRLLELGDADRAGHLEAHAHRWLADARRLIGLSHPDRRLGQYCPAHDEPLIELVAPGDQGHLSVDGKTIDWRHVDAVLCRHCRARWEPRRYIDLQIELDQADRRRIAAQQEQPA